MKKKKVLCLLLALSLLLCGCGGLLERSYSSLEPHSATYWENEEEDTLRADTYQDLVNALLLLVGERADEATVRLYGQEGEDMELMAQRACSEVQRETPMGAYLLDYITYSGAGEKDCYELSVRFGYRRTAEQQESIIGATNTEAIPELLRQTYGQELREIAIRVDYFSVDRAGVEALVWETQRELLALAEEEELTAAERWQVAFYPDAENVGIVEILLEGSGIEEEAAPEGEEALTENAEEPSAAEESAEEEALAEK